MIAGALMGVASVPLHVARRADIRVDDNVLVTGAGLIGSFAAQAASLMGAQVTIADRNQNKLDIIAGLHAARPVNIGGENGFDKLRAFRPYSVVLTSSERSGAAAAASLATGRGWCWWRAGITSTIPTTPRSAMRSA